VFHISRELHCALAGMEVGAFKTLQQYGRLPVLPAAFKPERPFGPLETLVLAIYDVMAEQHRISRAYAASICSGEGMGILAEHWNEFRETGPPFAAHCAREERRQAKKDDILFGRVTFPDLPSRGGGPRHVLGTLKDIVAELDILKKKIAADFNIEHTTPMSIIAISLTRVAYLVSNRAMKHEINLDHFWAEPYPGWSAGKKKSRKKAAAPS
jgi:hypothetical protein